MQLRLILATTLVSALMFSGCSGGEEGATEGATQEATDKKDPVADAAEKVGAGGLVDAAKALTNDGPPLTAEKYEEMMLALGSCEIKGRYIDRKCPAEVAFREARSNQKNALGKLGGAMAKLGRKHIAHEKAPVRLYAAGLLNSFLGASDDTLKVVLDRAPKEEHEAVVTKLLSAVGSKMKKSPEVAKLVMTLSDHKSPMVRKESISWLTSSWSDGVKGSLEKAMKMVDKDKDPEVRQYACSRLGRKVDEKALKTFKKYTSPKMAKSDPALHAKCMDGLSEMFLQWPHNDKNSKKGFDLFIKNMTVKKCTDKAPSWTVISGLKWAAKDGYDAKTPWFAKSKKKLLTSLEKVVTCKGANWMARTNAIKVLQEFKVDKANFGKMLKKIDKDTTSGVKHVKDALTKAGS